MSFTLSTVPLSLLALYLLYRAQWQILPVMMFMSVFQAASVLNLMGDVIGVAPSYALLLAFLVKNTLARKAPQQRTNSKSATILLVLFTIYAVESAFAHPVFFSGVPFTNPKLGFNVPLRWETGHLNQLFYLVLDVGLFFVVSRRCSVDELQRSLQWFVNGSVLASIIALYQLVCLKTGLAFPSEYLYTNLSYGTFKAYDIGQFSRINSTFVEASAAALILPPALALATWWMVVRPNLKDFVRAVFILIGLFLTLSTTGYLCLFFLAVVAMAILCAAWKARSVDRLNKLVLTCGVCILLLGSAIVPAVRSWTSDLLDTVIFSKTQTFSYEQRTEMNDDALQTARHTAWLGAGWGVCRASSLFPTMLGNVGLPGVVLLTAFLGRIFLPLWRIKRHNVSLKGPALFAASVVLIGLLVAGPELTSPPLWVFAGIASATFPGIIRRPIDVLPVVVSNQETRLVRTVPEFNRSLANADIIAD